MAKKNKVIRDEGDISQPFGGVHIPDKKDLVIVAERLTEDIKFMEKDLEKQGIEGSTELEIAKMRLKAVENQIATAKDDFEGEKGIETVELSSEEEKLIDEGMKEIKRGEAVSFEDLKAEGVEKMIRQTVKTLNEKIAQLNTKITIMMAERDRFEAMLKALSSKGTDEALGE